MRFRHPLIKTAVVDLSTVDQRRAAHRLLAEAFPNQPEQRGHHLAEAAFAPDEEIAAAVEAGAYQTFQRGDVVGGISRLMRAAELSPDRSDRSRRLTDAAYYGAYSAGQLDTSTEILRDAHSTDPGSDDTLRAVVATTYLLLNSDGSSGPLITSSSALSRPPWTRRRGSRQALPKASTPSRCSATTPDASGFWDPIRWVNGALADTAPTRGPPVAEALSDPLTASPSTLSELDRAIARLATTDRLRPHCPDVDRQFLHRPAPRCRNALLRVIRRRREGGAVGSAMMALSMLAFEELGSGHWQAAHGDRRAGDGPLGGARLPALHVERSLRDGVDRRQPRGPGILSEI